MLIRYFRSITLVAVLLTIAVNAAATSLPLNGISTAAVSDMYRNLFTPAGYVFIIWGVIYIGWLAFAIYPFTYPAGKSNWLLPAFPWFTLSAAANMLWLFLWHSQQLGWSVVVMLILLGSLIMVYQKLEIGVYKASTKTLWMVHKPISIYLGWISVATIANIAAALTQVGWTGFGISSEAWAVLLVLVAGTLAAVMLTRRHDYDFAAVIVWALVGIWLNLNGQYPNFEGVIGFVVGFLIVIAAVKLTRELMYKK